MCDCVTALCGSRACALFNKPAADWCFILTYRESLVFLATFILLAIIAFGKDNTTTYRLNHSLISVITTANGASADDAYSSISTSHDFWRWMHGDFMDIAYGQQAPDSKQVRAAVINHGSMTLLVILDQVCFNDIGAFQDD